MQHISMVPVLAVGLLVFWLYISIRFALQEETHDSGVILVSVWLSLLMIWGVCSKILAETGIYASDYFISLLPMLWIPLIPVIITGTMLLLRPFRIAIIEIIDHYQTALIWVQALRILAAGSLIKAYLGIFPVSFAIAVAIPDMLFGLSVIFVARKSMRELLNSRCLFRWNILGLLAILPAAPLVGQMGLPGVMYYFTSIPDARALFDYPMVLAPTLVVPFFLIMNGFFLLHTKMKENYE